MISAKPWFYREARGFLGSSPGRISSAASPNAGRIPFDQATSSAEHGVHLLPPLSLSWFLADFTPALQQQEEMKEVLAAGTLSGQGGSAVIPAN